MPIEDADRKTVAQAVRAYIAKERISCEEFAQRLNTGADKRGVNDLGAAILTSGVATLSHRLPARIRTPVGDFVRRSFTREVPRVPLPEHVKQSLADAIRDDTDRLRQFTGRDFAHWSV